MWRFITHNGSMKLLALVLAVLVWFYANNMVTRAARDMYLETHRADVTEVVRDVPVTVLISPEVRADVEILSSNPIDLAVVGPARDIQALTPDRIHAFIDVRRMKIDNDQPFSVKLLVEGLPEGVRLTRDIVVTARFKLPGSQPMGKIAP